MADDRAPERPPNEDRSDDGADDGVAIELETTGSGRRYRLTVDGAEAGELDFTEADDVRTYLHTGVREAFGGRGLASALVRRALDDARRDGVRVVAVCSYVKGYLERHPEEQDLLAGR